MSRITSAVTLLTILAFFSFAARPAQADSTHSGKVVSVTEGKAGSDGKLVMSDKDGKNEHNHAITSSTKIKRNSKTVKLSDLKKGDMIEVTTSDDGKVKEVAASEAKSNGKTGRSNASSDSSGSEEIPRILQSLNL